MMSKEVKTCPALNCPSAVDSHHVVTSPCIPTQPKNKARKRKLLYAWKFGSVRSSLDRANNTREHLHWQDPHLCTTHPKVHQNFHFQIAG